MSEINNYLNDESFNDKQLVKELSVYVKNHNKKKLPINKKFVSDVIDIILNNSEIFFSTIEFNYEGNGISAWHPSTKRLSFNITNILNNAKDYSKGLNARIGNNRILSYFSVLDVITHELTHARQSYVEPDEKYNIYNSSNEYIETDYDAYDNNHDLILVERYANLRGLSIAYQVLSYVFPKKQIQKLRNVIYYYLIYGYGIEQDGVEYLADFGFDLNKDTKVISAIDIHNKILDSYSIEHAKSEPNEDMTLYDRVYLGLPITVDEFKKLRDIYIEMNKNTEINDDVKKLINKK